MGPELLAGFAGRTSVDTFLPLCPSAMSRPDPRASKSRYKIVDTTGSHQNGKHLLGPSPGSEDAHENDSCDPEEEAKLMHVEAGNQNKMDTPDVIEMESVSEDEDVMKGVTDYDAGLVSAVSSSWSSASGSAAERQFGDSGNRQGRPAF